MWTTDGRTDGHRYDNTPSDDHGHQGGNKTCFILKMTCLSYLHGENISLIPCFSQTRDISWIVKFSLSYNYRQSCSLHCSWGHLWSLSKLEGTALFLKIRDRCLPQQNRKKKHFLEISDLLCGTKNKFQIQSEIYIELLRPLMLPPPLPFYPVNFCGLQRFQCRIIGPVKYPGSPTNFYGVHRLQCRIIRPGMDPGSPTPSVVSRTILNLNVK